MQLRFRDTVTDKGLAEETHHTLFEHRPAAYVIRADGENSTTVVKVEMIGERSVSIQQLKGEGQSNFTAEIPEGKVLHLQANPEIPFWLFDEEESVDKPKPPDYILELDVNSSPKCIRIYTPKDVIVLEAPSQYKNL